MLEVEPSSALKKLLREFASRGGVLDYAFYRSEHSQDSDVFHRRVAHRFLDDRAAAYFTHKWEPDALVGTRITFDSFWGTDDVARKQLGPRAWSIPNVDGYKTAFFHPPYGLRNGVEGNQTLFDDINRHILGEDRSSLVIWSWSTDCSGYFDAGHEWWGAFLWTLSRPNAQTVTLIGASSSD